MFNVGDKIVYPMHGAGIIESIEEKDVLGEKQAYYIVNMPGEVKVMVPTARAQEIGVRDIIDKTKVSEVIKVLEEDKAETEMNWNKRYRNNMDRMKSGDIYEIADIVRNLSHKQKSRSLSTGEKKMLLNAKQILVSEIVLADQMDKDSVEELVDSKIDLSYIKYAENRDKDSASNIVGTFIPYDAAE